MLFFMNPEREAQARKARAEYNMSHAVPWSEAKKPKGRHDIGIIAETYKIENPMDLVFPNAPVIKTGEGEDDCLYSDNRTLRYAKKIFPIHNGLPVTDAPDLWHDHGRAFFTADVTFPVLEQLKGEKWKPWMSLTPAEIWSQNSGIRSATKNVVIGGLGMGYLLDQVARKKTVTGICVVEKNKELLDWFGLKLCEQLEEKYDKTVDVICGDIWEEAGELGEDSRFLIDIWEGHGEAQFDRKLEELRADKKFVWAWGSPRGSRY